MIAVLWISRFWGMAIAVARVSTRITFRTLVRYHHLSSEMQCRARSTFHLSGVPSPPHRINQRKQPRTRRSQDAPAIRVQPKHT